MPLYKNKAIRYLILFLCFAAANPVSGQQENAVQKIKTVVIDPGHGGHDPGTISRGGTYKEKDIVLSVGLKLGSLIKSTYPGIKVIYTRSTDKFVELDERANIANRNKADLFISIHVNATTSTTANGTETFVMGTHKSSSNFELCKTENSVIVLEDNYQSKYEGFDPDSPESYIIFSLLQNTHLEQSLKLAELIQKHFKGGPVYGNRGVKQGGLIVLWRSTMPAILTEIGFLSNLKDRTILVSKEGQTSIAKKIFNAFCEYKQNYESDSRELSPETTAKTIVTADTAESRPESPAQNNGEDYYSIQILSVTRILEKNASDLKGRKDCSYIKTAGGYKYMIGKYATRQEAARALPAIKKNFAGAFVIHIENGQIVK